MKKILIIDDDRDICNMLAKFLSKHGFDTDIAYNGKTAVKLLKENTVDLVLCDFKLPDATGIEILQKVKIIDSRIQVIIITGYSDVRIAVDAVKKGAVDYVTKPLYPDEILHTIKTVLSMKDKKVSESGTHDQAREFYDTYIEGQSPQSQMVQRHINLIAPTDMSVIIMGDTGTGKEFIAKAIHFRSKRANKPFVAIDCGALIKDLAGSELFGHVKGAYTGAVGDKPGSFELADGGTLFLDEISNLTYENQIKLLRVLQERKIKRVGDIKDIPVDVRLIVASNENLKNSVIRGDFREDIYHRINEFRIDLAPLRERKEDVVQYSKHFLKEANKQLGKQVQEFNPEVLKKFKSYSWPGNLRELRNVIKRAVLLTDGAEIELSCLPEEIKEPANNRSSFLEISFNGVLPSNLKKVSREAEKFAIQEVLKRTNNNKTETAKILGVDRKTLYNKMKIHHISQS
ncbi:MAG: sigma-54-dependent Fis family transcriptional regulator [Cyclobacteriaceae bacterium]|nr:sigma-54-dependent Fis family transcriptional regulator [Cyclobacteriaceae bacterium]